MLARVSWRRRFCIGLSTRPGGSQAQPVTDWELASRLSYFLWASLPDDELRRLAATGELGKPDVLASRATHAAR